MLIFIRHFNCFVCRDLVKELATNLDKIEELKEYNVDMKVVGCGNQRIIPMFGQDTGFDSRKIFVDPKRDIYGMLGLFQAKGVSEISSKDGLPLKSNFFTGMTWSLWKSITRSDAGNVY